MSSERSNQRKQEILQALAAMLETSPGQRITTAAIATQVGVSEAALYRHFPSKARMFEGLIEFIEDTFYRTISQILVEHHQAEPRILLIMQMMLVFAEKNPGLCRILCGDVLQGEQVRLRERVAQLFDKIEQQLKLCLRERKLREGKQIHDEAAIANLILSIIEGLILQYVRSGFTKKPQMQFDSQWQLLRLALFVEH